MTRRTRPLGWITAATVLATIAVCLMLALLGFHASSITLAPDGPVRAAPPENMALQVPDDLSGTITVGKVTEPSGGTQEFGFTASYSMSGFTLSDGEWSASGLLEAATYAVTETVPPGWDLSAISCQGGLTSTWTTDLDTRSVAIALAEGEDVTCVFTNTELGTIVIQKETDPAGGAGFEFAQDIDDTGPFGLDDGDTKIFTDLLPGTYTVTEEDPLLTPGRYALTNLTCVEDGTGNSTTDVVDRGATIALEAGETVTCTFTNTELGTIVIEKETDLGGGTGFEFTDNIEAPFSFSLDDGDLRVFTGLLPDTYTVREQDPLLTPGGYALTNLVCVEDGIQNSATDLASREAAIALDAGETVACTFTNAERGTIVIEKETDPGGGTGFEFTDDIEAPFGFSLDDDDVKIFTGLPPDTYTVTEEDPLLTPGGYLLTDLVCVEDDIQNSTTDVVSREAAIALEAGETVTCVYTNTEQGTIVIEKETDPGGGTGFEFAQDIDDTGPFELDDGDVQIFTGLPPDTYTVTEEDPLLTPGGYALTNLVCVEDGTENSATDVVNREAAIALEAGETVTCTFTNTEQGTIVIEKETDPGGGTGFEFTDDIEAPFGFSLDDGDTKIFADLPPDTYTVTEEDPLLTPGGYALTNLVCVEDGTENSTTDVVNRGATIALEAGETVTCTFTNTEQGTILIKKETDPGGGTGFEFTNNIEAPFGFSLDDGDLKVFTDLPPDTYTVREQDPLLTPGGYALTNLVCVEDGTENSATDVVSREVAIALDAGETVTCVYTNTQQAGRIEVVKVLEPDTDSGRFNLQIDGTTDPDAQDVGDGGSTGMEIVATGEHTVGETAGTGTNLGDYDTAISCVDLAAQGTVVASSTTVSLTVPVGYHDIVCTITNTAKADLAIFKFDEPSKVDAGHTLTYTVRVINNGPADAQDVVVTDTLPAHVTYESYEGEAHSCLEDPPGTLTCQLGTVEASETASFDIVVSVSADAENTLRNTVAVASTTHDPDSTDNVDDELTSVEFNPTIKVAKSGPVSAKVGDMLVYTFTVTNEDDEGDGSPITDVTLSDDIVDPVYVSGDQDGDDVLDLTESWLFVAERQVEPTDPSQLVNTATAFGRDIDRDVITSTDTHTVTIVFEPRITVEKTGPALASLGDTALYTFTVRNDGISGDGSPIHSVDVTDTLAGEAVLVRGDADGDSLLEVTETWVFTAAHTPTSIGTLTNTATASGQDGNGDPVTATDDHSVIVYHAAIEVEKTGPAESDVGDVVAYTVTITNASSANAPILSLDSITDSLKGDLTSEANVVTNTCTRTLATGNQCQIIYTYAVQRGDSTPLVNTVWVESRALGVTKVVTVSAEHAMGVTTFVYLPLLMGNYPPPWEQGTGLPAGVQVRTLAVCASNPDVVYVGFGPNGHGVYKSVNAGRTWAQTGLRDAEVFDIAIAPGSCNAVYAGAWEAGVMKSVNGGSSWDSAGGLNGAFVYSMAIDPLDSDVVYAGTAQQGVYRSPNAGSSWGSWGLSGLTVPDLVFFAPPDETEQVLYAATWEDGVYKRPRSGASWGAWTSVSEGIARQYRQIYAVNVGQQDASTVFAATYAGGLYRTLNGGEAWTQVLPSPGTAYAVAVDPANSDIVYVGTRGGGVYRSTANGDQGTWHPLNIQLGSLVVRSLAIGPASAEYIHVGTSEGAWRRLR